MLSISLLFLFFSCRKSGFPIFEFDSRSFLPSYCTHNNNPDCSSSTWIYSFESESSLATKWIICLQKGGGNERQLQLFEQRLSESERKCSIYSKRCNRVQVREHQVMFSWTIIHWLRVRVQGDYQNLIGITADLVDSLERTVQGDPVTPEYLQQICTRLFSNQACGPFTTEIF